jgi:hypothetical protein
MIFILIQIKFDIGVNNGNQLETIWEHKNKKKKKLIILGGVQQCKAQFFLNYIQTYMVHLKPKFLTNPEFFKLFQQNFTFYSTTQGLKRFFF